jgi:hypothetical protein
MKMKNILAIILLTAIVGCKKKNVSPAPAPTPVCETKTKLFEGKYISNTQNHDTVKIVFNHNNCPSVDVNTYSVYGLGKALKSTGTSVALDTVAVFSIISNEVQKSAVTSSVICTWGFMSTGALSCNYKNVGAIQFTRIN